jgi:hypothetical protein
VLPLGFLLMRDVYLFATLAWTGKVCTTSAELSTPAPESGLGHLARWGEGKERVLDTFTSDLLGAVEAWS